MVTVDQSRNVYVDDSGAIVPRVSSIVRLLDPDCYSMVSDSAMATASRRGTWVHEAIDRFHSTGNWSSGDLEIDRVVAPYMPGYFQFLEDTQAEPLEGEKVVSHRMYGYAGRLDKIYRVRGRLTVLDFKVTAAMPKTVWVQLAAYMEAENDCRRVPSWVIGSKVEGRVPLITDRAALRLRPDGKYDLRRPPEPFPEDLRVFLAALQIYRWSASNLSKGVVPRF